MALALACISLGSLGVACSTGSRRILLADGSYELKCQGELSTCLIQMEKTCKDYGYEVLRATEKRERSGPIEPLPNEVVRSEAIVRCRKPNALLSVEPPPPAPAPTEAPPPLPHHAPLPPLSAPPSSTAPAAPSVPAPPPAAPSVPAPPPAAPAPPAAPPSP